MQLSFSSSQEAPSPFLTVAFQSLHSPLQILPWTPYTHCQQITLAATSQSKETIYRNSFKFLSVGRHANLCRLGGELGRRARRLIFQDPSLPLSPLSSGPLLKPVSSLLIHLQSLLVIDSILSACKPDTISPMKIQATAPRFLLNTEATGDSSDRSCRVFQGRGPTTLASGNWIMMGAIVKGSRCKGCGLPWWLRRQRIRLQRGRPGFAIWVGKIPWRREQLPNPVFLPGEFHGQRSLGGYNPWGHKELDTVERLSERKKAVTKASSNVRPKITWCLSPVWKQ